MRLRHVHENEDIVKAHKEKVLAVWEKNLPGPETYIKVYEAFGDVLDGSARNILKEFLRTSKQLEVRDVKYDRVTIFASR
jgi:hypothetical protein